MNRLLIEKMTNFGLEIPSGSLLYYVSLQDNGQMLVKDLVNKLGNVTGLLDHLKDNGFITIEKEGQNGMICKVTNKGYLVLKNLYTKKNPYEGSVDKVELLLS